MRILARKAAVYLLARRGPDTKGEGPVQDGSLCLRLSLRVLVN